MTLDPLTPQFWAHETNLLWEAIDEVMLAAVLAGGTTGIDLLPLGARGLVNVDIFNGQAISYLQKYRLTTVPGITETTRRQAVRAIHEWLLSGESLPALEARLAPLFGSNRASMIAITEVTRAYAEGNMMMWRAAGVVGAKRWRTAHDEKVCPICGPLEGTVVNLNSEYQFNPEVFAETPQMRNLLGKGYTPEAGRRRANSMLKHLGSSVQGPPAHPNCRCWLQPIVSDELFERELERILGL